LGSTHTFVYYESATVIITFILAGKYLEERSKRKTLAAVKELASLQPKNVSVMRNNQQLLIPASMVLPDDVVEVTTGERIPVDGVIITGSSFIDESMVTGEPIPVQKTTGDKVYAGTLNSNGFLTLSATKSGRETLLSEIIRLVKEAQSAKPPIQLLADKIASVFVPVVLVIAVLTFAIWWFAGPENQPGLALITTISVLIIACPCALGLATPTALMAGLGKGASSGILIRNTEQLENLCKTKALVLDKTGTLTYGKPMVSESYWFIESLNLKRILYSIQRQSTHPLAKAVVAHLGNVEPIPTDAFSEIGGKGLLATVEGKNYVVGNRVFLEENKISIPDQLPEGTHVLFAENQNLVAYFMIEDQLKDHAIEAISAIKKLGITPVMLTGDSKKTAAHIAALAGIDTYFAEVLPTDKHQIISTLKTKYSHVAMVGDGINDSAALASADAGIAMGGGSDIAINSAGIILMNNDLRLLSQAVKLSRATVRTIRQNFFWAFFYNIIAIPVAAGILFPLNGFLLNPMIAGAAMALSSVTVVTNSLRLRKIAL
jgi:Cu2+-exporting ATPase